MARSLVVCNASYLLWSFSPYTSPCSSCACSSVCKCEWHFYPVSLKMYFLSVLTIYHPCLWGWGLEFCFKHKTNWNSMTSCHEAPQLVLPAHINSIVMLVFLFQSCYRMSPSLFLQQLLIGLFYQPCMTEMWIESTGEWCLIWENWSIQQKTCQSSIFSTTHPKELPFYWTWISTVRKMTTQATVEHCHQLLYKLSY